jgi:hypothetical protein
MQISRHSGVDQFRNEVRSAICLKSLRYLTAPYCKLGCHESPGLLGVFFVYTYHIHSICMDFLWLHSFIQLR